jgi:hypothetical protein
MPAEEPNLVDVLAIVADALHIALDPNAPYRAFSRCVEIEAAVRLASEHAGARAHLVEDLSRRTATWRSEPFP